MVLNTLVIACSGTSIKLVKKPAFALRFDSANDVDLQFLLD
ncbi:hypothetical protein [Bacillus sp. E214]|nr:hypothetical protein [Bacillus sp. E214]